MTATQPTNSAGLIAGSRPRPATISVMPPRTAWWQSVTEQSRTKQFPEVMRTVAVHHRRATNTRALYRQELGALGGILMSRRAGHPYHDVNDRWPVAAGASLLTRYARATADGVSALVKNTA